MLVLATKKMRYDPDKHHRRSIRLPGFDYSKDGAYFITICTRNRECILTEIDVGAELASALGPSACGPESYTEAGKMVERTWQSLSKRYMHVWTDEYVIMPNHVHGIVMILSTRQDTEGAESGKRIEASSIPTLGTVVQSF